MKKFLVTMFLLIATNSFAGVTGEIISYKQDENGNIEVHTQYKQNGVEVQSRYPQENGKYYWVTRYSLLNFVLPDGTMMNEAQIKERILKDITQFGEALVEREFVKKNNQEILSNSLSTLVGSKKDIDTTKIIIKDDKGKPVKNWEIRDNGNKVETNADVVGNGNVDIGGK